MIVTEHYSVGAALDGSGHHILHVQAHPVGGALPQPDRCFDVAAGAQRDQHGALVVRPGKLGHQVAAQLFRGLEAALSVGAAAPVIPADLRQHVQQPCRGGADALHGAQFFLAGLQHRGKVPEPLQQVIRDLVGIPLSIGRIQDIFQHFMVGQTVQPVVLHPLPHALAVPLMPFVFCHGGSPFQRSFFIVPISGTELKPPGKIFRAGCVDLAGFVY